MNSSKLVLASLKHHAAAWSAVILAAAFRHLGWTEIRASTDDGNAAAVRVLEKLGFKFDRQAVVDELDTRFYSLSQHQK